MDTKKYFTRKEQAWLHRLEKESDRILNMLSEQPSNSRLVSLLNEIDIKIVTLTREHTVEY